MKKHLFLTIVLLFTSLIGKAQYYDLKISSVTDQFGKPAGATFDIVEDSLGFIWFGTLNGLVRYDGYGFKTFKHEKDNQNSLSNNMIRAMLVDKKGNILIGTQGGGLNVFNPITETFAKYTHNPKNDNSITNNDVWAIEEDRLGNIWVGTWARGLNRLNIQSGEITRYWLGESAEDGVRSILSVDDSTLLVGLQASGLVKLNPKTREFKRFTHNPSVKGSISSNQVYHIYKLNDGRILVSTFGGGINVYDTDNDFFYAIKYEKGNVNSFSSNDIYRVLHTRGGNQWIGYDRAGISTYNYESNTFRHFTKDFSNGKSLSSDMVRCLFEDSNGIIWVGTEVGVDKIVESKNFIVFRYSPSNPNSLNTRVVRTIFQDSKGLIWIGAYDAFMLNYDPVRKEFNKNGKMISAVGIYPTTSIIEDFDNNFWIGTSYGIFVFDRKENLITRILHNPNSNNTITDNTIQIIRKGNNRELWIGTENGLNIFNKNTKQWTNFHHQPNNPNSLSSGKIQPNALIIEESGVVWAGTWAGGLNKYLPDKNIFKRYIHNPNDTSSISNNNVIALHKDDNYLWLGTFGGGLNRLNIETDEIKVYTEIDGLPNNIVFAVHSDEEGYLWLSTDNGLSRFNPETEEFLNFDINDGLPSNQFFWGSSFVSPTGEMFFGGTDGMIKFHPSNIMQSSYTPPLYITDVKEYNQSLSFTKSSAFISRLEFSYKVKSFQIEFTSLDYSVPQKNQFAYRLGEGEWTYNGNRNYINFMNIAPGNYKLSIKATNSDGVWNEEGITIDLEIVPPYWQTWWFRIGVILFVILLVATIYRLRIIQINNQKKELELTVKMRTEELLSSNEELNAINEELYRQREELEDTLEKLKNTQNQLIQSEKLASVGILAAGVAHEINNPLNFIKGGIIALQNYFKENIGGYYNDVANLFEMINTGVSRATGIVTSLNHYSRKDDSKAVETDIHTIIENCLLMLNNQLKHRVTVERDYTSKSISLLCNEGKMHQAILNILSNAEQSIEEEGVITIKTQVKGDSMIISISDNGCGIKPEDLPRITDPFFTTKEAGKGTGLGLSITLNIIEEHKGKLEFQSELGNGTSVIITLPIAST